MDIERTKTRSLSSAKPRPAETEAIPIGIEQRTTCTICYSTTAHNSFYSNQWNSSSSRSYGTSLYNAGYNNAPFFSWPHRKFLRNDNNKNQNGRNWSNSLAFPFHCSCSAFIISSWAVCNGLSHLTNAWEFGWPQSMQSSFGENHI